MYIVFHANGKKAPSDDDEGEQEYIFSPISTPVLSTVPSVATTTSTHTTTTTTTTTTTHTYTPS